MVTDSLYELYLNPVSFATSLLGFTPDRHQANLLTQNPHRCILNCTRQWGKSSITAAKAVHQAYFEPESLTIVVTPSARQSAEFLRKASKFLRHLQIRPRGDGDNEISLLLPNGSRIVGLPGVESTVRGFSSVSLLLIDEAARVPDELYASVRPMLAQSNGQLWLMSTPNGQRGFFYEAWNAGQSNDGRLASRSLGEGWSRISIPASECTRISADFLNEERATNSDRWFRQEYGCEFAQSEDQIIDTTVIDAAMSADIDPLPIDVSSHTNIYIPQPKTTTYDPFTEYPDTPLYRKYYIGVDLGQARDHSAVTILEKYVYQTGPPDRVYFKRKEEKRYAIRYLKRFPLGMTYDAIAQEIRRIARAAPIYRGEQDSGNRTLIVDATGVGAPVIENLKKLKPDCRIIPVIITSGQQLNKDNATWRVPKQDLFSNLVLWFEKGIVKIADQLPDAKTLAKELIQIRIRQKGTGYEEIGAFGHNQHDDLSIATALACWYAQRQ